ncbi:6107_t:CDS:2 [Ambispora gerdemannii]|uniref:6107_t:CDS:1 n=1 Tax=Ambispora gerdemannii TaxID=144530 RepID=A0A9N8ZTI0_9GLOM|nr:6107_t:CDS:2 [Ambispora gerdemannii]
MLQCTMRTINTFPDNFYAQARKGSHRQDDPPSKNATNPTKLKY